MTQGTKTHPPLHCDKVLFYFMYSFGYRGMYICIYQTRTRFGVIRGNKYRGYAILFRSVSILGTSEVIAPLLVFGSTRQYDCHLVLETQTMYIYHTAVV